VASWMQECFDPVISADTVERNDRLIEEALVQACGGTRDDCHTLVDYVFNRPVGDPVQEVGGVMVTLGGALLDSAFEYACSRGDRTCTHIAA